MIATLARQASETVMSSRLLRTIATTSSTSPKMLPMMLK